MRFAGYAAIFDRPDRGGDIVRKGAFARARADGTPVLWQHDASRAIGWVENLAEDAHGLRVIAEVNDASEAAALLASGKVSGLSFGYRVRSARQGTYRELNQVELIEISLVTHPMQPLARVLATEPTKGEDDGL